MKTIKDLKYSKEHEWIKVEGNKVHIGITDFAQDSLGDIVFVELPEVGTTISAEDVFGVVESVKAASDLFSPVSGEVVEINEDLEDSPEFINENPYEAWMIAVELSDITEIDDLMNEKEYLDFCSKED